MPVSLPLSFRSFADRVAARIAEFAGSVWSIFLHGLVFGSWIILNTGVVSAVAPWDPTLVILAMVASVEAIFLTSFVLVNQRRQEAVAEERAELTLQVGLLAEHEMTKLATLTIEIARTIHVPNLPEMDTDELTQHIAPETILEEIDRQRVE